MSIQDDLPAVIPEPDEKSQNLLRVLLGYKREALDNRKNGLNPRDDKWRQNLDLYWNRYDFSDKAVWQSKNVMPEVPGFVDRFAAALKDALVSTPNGFYTVTDPYDKEGDMTNSIKKMTDVWLSTCGRNQVGQTMDFSTVFEDQMKLGALMAASGVVLWKDDVPGGRVAIESVDPRFVWLDHTYRDLYRIRRTELDTIDIARMATAKSSKGNSIYNLSELNRLVGTLGADMRREQQELVGHSTETMSQRKPVVLDEYIASVVDDSGKILMDDEVVIVANDQFILRGPEKNPFWHGKDWLVYTPLMPVPLSPYGRSYMEDFGSIAKVYNDLTNLILDATYMASMKAYVLVPSMLSDPSQANSGVWPNKIFRLEEGYNAEDFAKELMLGSIDPGAISVWQALKSELGDAAGMNEIGMGQLPDKTHIAATAVAGAQQSSSAIMRSVAQTVETRFLDPMLDLVWKTGLQHASLSDQRMADGVGPMYGALMSQRKQLIKRPITFQARGISSLIQKSQKLQALLGIMQVISANPNLLAAFMSQIDIKKFVAVLLNLSNVDPTNLEASARDLLISQITQSMPMAGQGGGAPPPGATPGGSPPAMKQMGDLATQMGVAK